MSETETKVEPRKVLRTAFMTGFAYVRVARFGGQGCLQAHVRGVGGLETVFSVSGGATMKFSNGAAYAPVRLLGSHNGPEGVQCRRVQRIDESGKFVGVEFNVLAEDLCR